MSLLSDKLMTLVMCDSEFSNFRPIRLAGLNQCAPNARKTMGPTARSYRKKYNRASQKFHYISKNAPKIGVSGVKTINSFAFANYTTNQLTIAINNSVFWLARFPGFTARKTSLNNPSDVTNMSRVKYAGYVCVCMS